MSHGRMVTVSSVYKVLRRIEELLEKQFSAAPPIETSAKSAQRLTCIRCGAEIKEFGPSVVYDSIDSVTGACHIECYERAVMGRSFGVTVSLSQQDLLLLIRALGDSSIWRSSSPHSEHYCELLAKLKPLVERPTGGTKAEG